MNTMAAEIERHGDQYVCPDVLDLAVRVARATTRPLLLFGAPGSGKSSLAKHIAAKQNLRFYEHVVTARTTARDLLWSFDTVRRLSDAQTKTGVKPDKHYISPGALWWAFDRVSAADHPRTAEPHPDWNATRADRGAVVLIDEIDKADPDVPNSLLVPLADRYFTVTDLDQAQPVHEKPGPDGESLIIITSNEERELPPAFERRCVVHRLDEHDKETLKIIAGNHTGSDDKYPLDFLIGRLTDARRTAKEEQRRQPSTAEFIDAIKACVREGITTADHPSLKPVLEMIYTKKTRGDAVQGWPL
ncbi:AAA family ATPase [Lentzea nigeriaca]|uniref:AAA family ATPase n=1 Tax=Lentzea nigeriaca TaxID=1128665 RepID=UPI001959E46B|nr:MoxR family ATPase [Lentzea nigeriaca]MBM7864339.1 MoxR-like ATPase [Lentzea nigeriaca]